MATSVYTPTLVKRTKTSAELVGIYTLAFSTADYATGGLLPGTNTFAVKTGFTNRKPDWVDIQGNAGYIYSYVYASGKIMIFAQTNAAAEDAPLGELAVAAMPAAALADVIRCRVGWFTTPALPAS